ncbi:MAG: VanZ family protein [Deltaproteobacteria bacterium]|nr:VanZ family protein [Deltaproteobacteria bacterium]
MARPASQVAIRYLPALVGAVAIFAVSSMSRPPIPEILEFWNSDKLLHAIAYAGLATLILIGARARTGHLGWSARLEAALGATLYGMSDEWHQSFVPGRGMSSYDLIADTAGACLGAFVLGVLVLRRWPRQPS